MNLNDDRPDADGEGADDHNVADWNSRWNDLNATATAGQPPLSTALRDRAESNGLGNLIPFLTDHIPPSHRLSVLAYVIDMSSDNWRILRKARIKARCLVKVGKKIGADTLPAMLAEYGYSRTNDFRKTLLVAAVVCAWPDEFRGKEDIRIPRKKGSFPIAIKLIASGWSPPMRRRNR